MENIIRPGLESGEEAELIDAEHDCFQLPILKAFRKKYNVSRNAWNNFVRLLCGYRKLPFIVLQNPTKDHDLEYDKMVECPTIRWMSETLTDIGLKLEEVPILDVCILLSTKNINYLGSSGIDKWAAVEESYQATQELVKVLRPKVVVSCQCATEGRVSWNRVVTWASAKNTLAQDLCSSRKLMKRACAKVIRMEGHTMWMVYGMHPMRLEYSQDPTEETILKQVIKDVYGPCKLWLDRRSIRSRRVVRATSRTAGTRTQVILNRSEEKEPKQDTTILVEDVEEVQEVGKGKEVERLEAAQLDGNVGGLISNMGKLTL